MNRLTEALKLLGVNQSTPSHVVHTLVMNILSLALTNNDQELEQACEAKAEEIRALNTNKIDQYPVGAVVTDEVIYSQLDGNK